MTGFFRRVSGRRPHPESWLGRAFFSNAASALTLWSRSSVHLLQNGNLHWHCEESRQCICLIPGFCTDSAVKLVRQPPKRKKFSIRWAEKASAERGSPPKRKKFPIRGEEKVSAGHFTANEKRQMKKEMKEDNKKACENVCPHKLLFVRLQGLEPWTPWLRVRCSTSWARSAYLISAMKKFSYSWRKCYYRGRVLEMQAFFTIFFKMMKIED